MHVQNISLQQSSNHLTLTTQEVTTVVHAWKKLVSGTNRVVTFALLTSWLGQKQLIIIKLRLFFQVVKIELYYMIIPEKKLAAKIVIYSLIVALVAV